MLLVKKVSLYTSFVVLAIIILALGVVNYIQLSAIAEIEAKTGGDGMAVTQALKFNAENLLYLSIVGVVVLIITLFVVHRGGVRVLRQMDKVTELSRQGRYFSGESVKKLGKLGEKINRLFGELNRLNEMKTLKISALTNLIGFLLDESNLHCFIADIQGAIGAVSRQLIARLKIDKLDKRGRTVSDMIRDIDFKEICAQLDRDRIPVVKKGLVLQIGDTTAQGQLTFHPVFNSKNELANVVCISEKEKLLEGITKKADQIVKARRRLSGIFKKQSQELDQSGD
jgi:hypothetical protein